MPKGTHSAEVATSRPEWHSALSRYARSQPGRATWQLVNTLIPYAALWVVMVWTLARGHVWLLPALIPVAAGFLVRTFIIFHDCCHGSFFPSRRANRAVGYFTGILSFTAFDDWRWAHLTHHSAVVDLDRHGPGEISTMTVADYRSATRMRRFGYRLYRHPLVLFVVGPFYQFFLRQRLPGHGAPAKARTSVLTTNLALLAIATLAGLTIGIGPYLLVQLPVMLLAGAAGIWLFYVQHQYDGVRWVRSDEWDPIRASIEGSSYYRLPGLLRWFTGNIGLHHIHHAGPRIPNYRLRRCLDGVPALRDVEPLTIRASLRSIGMKLWCEETQRLVSFRSLRSA